MIQHDDIYFDPGCGLALWRPQTAERALEWLRSVRPNARRLDLCCEHDSDLPAGSLIIDACPGCDMTFREEHDGVSAITLWEAVDELGGLDLPDLGGVEMSVHDSCPLRDRPDAHRAVRSLLTKMNVKIVECEARERHSICCGATFIGHLPHDKVLEKMRERAASMPRRDVAVVCVSCVRSLTLGGAVPHHLIDLLFGGETDASELLRDDWIPRVDAYSDAH